MNIAVILEQGIKEGGGFQQALSTIFLLNKYKSPKYNFIFFTAIEENIAALKKSGIEAHLLKLSHVTRVINYFRKNELVYKIIRKSGFFRFNKFDKALRAYDIDLIYFLSPSGLSLETEKYNYIFTVWDLCHRDFVEFPEVREFREFEMRERLFHAALPKAVKVIADSESGKGNIIRRYNIDEQRVVVLPFLPSLGINIANFEYQKNYIDVKAKYNINGDYIYYPAQFWSHKNHIYILEGLKILKGKYNVKISAVFSGSDKGNLDFILKKGKEFGLEEQIYYIGFVSNEEIPYLYRQALALVMPTYFGPTNIPPLEAFKLECPVLYPDLPGLREQVKDSALLMDLADPESLARNLIKVIEKDKEIGNLVKNGKRKIEDLREEDYWLVFQGIFDDYARKLKCWKE